VAQLSVLSKNKVTLTVENVLDLAGNKLEGSVVWDFVVADLGIESEIVTLNGVQLTQVYNAAYANLINPLTVAFTSSVVEDVSVLLEIASEQIQVVAIRALTAATLELDIQITTSSGESRGALELARELFSNTVSNEFDQQLSYLDILQFVVKPLSTKVRACSFFCVLAVLYFVACYFTSSSLLLIFPHASYI
jgi:hypothetical protein